MYFTYTYEELKRFCEDAFQRFGFQAEEAAIIGAVENAGYGANVCIPIAAKLLEMCKTIK